MRHLSLIVFLCLSTFTLSQQKGPADELPRLEHMNAGQVNPQIDPCTDFYQYSCSKFFAANPIPPDRAAWGVAGPLQQWNETVLRQSLEAAAAKKQGRTAVEQKIGDYWTSCMNESAVESASGKAFQLELKR
ncbi:MAG TPA: M13 family metallopeptidase N-terminal domain-containing protein, partial [Candidatus Angelobacter sp.]